MLWVLLDSIKDVHRSSVKVPEFGRHIGRNVWEITIKIKTIVWKPLILKVVFTYLLVSPPSFFLSFFLSFFCCCRCFFLSLLHYVVVCPSVFFVLYLIQLVFTYLLGSPPYFFLSFFLSFVVVSFLVFYIMSLSVPLFFSFCTWYNSCSHIY